MTYVHQQLWPALLALATAREAWQLDDLSIGAHWLLDEVDATEQLQTDAVVLPTTLRGGKRVADLARELERRLLVHAAEMHTPSGAHAKILQTWPLWSTGLSLPPPSMPAAQARAAPQGSRRQTRGGRRGRRGLTPVATQTKTAPTRRAAGVTAALPSRAERLAHKDRVPTIEVAAVVLLVAASRVQGAVLRHERVGIQPHLGVPEAARF